MKEDGYLIWCGDDDLSSGQRRYTKRAQREADDVADMEGYSSATHIGQFEGFLVFAAMANPFASATQTSSSLTRIIMLIGQMIAISGTLSLMKSLTTAALTNLVSRKSKVRNDIRRILSPTAAGHRRRAV